MAILGFDYYGELTKMAYAIESGSPHLSGTAKYFSSLSGNDDHVILGADLKRSFETMLMAQVRNDGYDVVRSIRTPADVAACDDFIRSHLGLNCTIQKLLPDVYEAAMSPQSAAKPKHSGFWKSLLRI